MKTKNQVTLARKTFYGIMLLGLFFSAFGMGDLPTVQAQKRVTSIPHTEIVHVWSPVDNIVLYWSLNSENSGPGLRPYDLNLYNAQTDQHHILASDGYAGLARFSKDGSTISFWYDNAPYIVELDNEAVSVNRVETDDVLIKGAFSSNNDILIYTTESDEVRVRNLTTNLETSLGIFEDISTLPYLFPEWSPNDQWVAFGTESNGILIDPSGIDNSLILPILTLPQSEFSSAIHYFIWSNGSSSLYDYYGKLIYNFTSKAEPALIIEPEILSFDGAFEILYLNNELFLHNTVTNTKKQLTTNESTVEQMLQSATPSQPNDDVTAQAIADGFDFPVGKPNMSGYNTTAGCWWLQRDGACAPGPHPGQDFNGNGGGDSDLNDPVYAVANGDVVYSADAGSPWGNIILIQHTLPDNTTVWSQYAHLNSRWKSVGDTVSKGDQIGLIGKGGWAYAHLHFEIRIAWRDANFWPSGWSDDTVRQYYVNPTDYINSHRTIGGGTQSNCPIYNFDGVVLWDQDNCYGTGLTVNGATGVINLSDHGWNDRAESIYVHDGWSLRVWQDSNAGLATSCIYGSKWDLNQDKYETDSSRSMHRDVSSIQVFQNSSCTGGSAPNTPSNFRASGSTQYSVTIAWDDVSNESGYKIYKWNGSTATFDYLASVGTNVTSYTETRSNCGWDDYYEVSAYNSYGESVHANWVQAFTQSCPAIPSMPSLSSPGNGQYFNEGESINLSWSATGSEYYGEVWGGPGGTLTFGWQSGTSKNIGSQWAGYTYSWHVKARNSSGESGWSETRTFTVRPGAPTNLSATAASCSQINLGWSDNSGNEEGYKVYRNGSLIATLGSGVTSYPSTSLAGNTNYSYTVNAYRGSIESAPSNTANATTQTCANPPGSPTSVSVTDGTYTDRVRISWTASSGATSYQVYRNSSNSSSGASLIGSPSSSPFDDTSVAVSTTYWYFVKACNSIGCSGFSLSDSGYRATTVSTDDNYEENDTLATAYDLSNNEQTWLSAINGYGKQADADWYRIYVTPEYVRVQVDAQFTHSQGDIDIALYDSAGINLASSTGVSDNEHIVFTVPTGGTYYYIRVYYGDRGNQYNLWWDDIQPTITPPVCSWPSYTAPATPTFGDVPMNVATWSWVERLSRAGITAGCGGGNFCPGTEVNRAQMSIFLLRGKYCGSSYIPPAVGGSSGFNDVPADSTMAPWVKQLAVDGITAGCGNGNFCPGTVVNRASMAIFLLRAKHGGTYTPPAVGGSSGFNDVPAGDTIAPWVKQLAAEGITAGCGNGNFCPGDGVNRAQMAIFLVRAFGLP